MYLLTVILTSNLFLTGSIDLWIEPSWITNSTNSRSKYASYQAQIFACKGEEESIQLHLLSSEDLKNISIVELNHPVDLPSPKIYIVKPVEGIPLPQGGIDKSILVPDILYPQHKFDLLKGQKAIFWVTYKIPAETQAKTYTTELALVEENKRLKRIQVAINVFDFTLPIHSSLPALTFLDPINLSILNKIGESIENISNEILKSIIDKRLIPSLNLYATNIYSIQPFNDYNYWSSLFSFSDSQPVIDVTSLLLPPGPLDTVKTPSPDEENLWNQIVKKTDNKYFTSVFFIPEDDKFFNPLRKFLSSIAEQVPLVQRILCGIPSSFFNTQVDIWAIPFYYYSHDLVERLKNGIPLSEESKIPIKSASSSSRGPMPATYPQLMSSANNVVDGNINIGWFSLPIKDNSKKEWVEIQFKAPIQGEKVIIVWGKFQTPRSVDLFVSKDGVYYFASSVNWKHFTGNPFEYPYSVGNFKYTPEFVGLRLEFKGMKKDDVINIQEVLLNPLEKDELTLVRAIQPIQPWLFIVPNDFPSLAYYSHPIEPRLIPWICWNLKLAGVVLTPLINWGNMLTKPRNTEELTFTPQDLLQSTTLLYPSVKHGFIPSVRLERLRDGLEDYEYLKLLQSKSVSTKLNNQELYKVLNYSPESFLPWNATDEKFIEELVKLRILIGIELSENKSSHYKGVSKSPEAKATSDKKISIQPVRKNFRGRTEK
ncbi:MAG: DUF4091 domain-containing protein [Candidatus Hydrogenedentes bacterium]|nr:DUF4091 domain-containing protein [Candidatus Hydrogenedentota bacterium]